MRDRGRRSTDPDPQTCRRACANARLERAAQFLGNGVYVLRDATDRLGNAGVEERTVEIVRGIPPIIRWIHRSFLGTLLARSFRPPGP